MWQETEKSFRNQWEIKGYTSSLSSWWYCQAPFQLCKKNKNNFNIITQWPNNIYQFYSLMLWRSALQTWQSQSYVPVRECFGDSLLPYLENEANEAASSQLYEMNSQHKTQSKSTRFLSCSREDILNSYKKKIKTEGNGWRKDGLCVSNDRCCNSALRTNVFFMNGSHHSCAEAMWVLVTALNKQNCRAVERWSGGWGAG